MTREELVTKYKEIHKKETGKDLPDQEAFDRAMKLVTLVKAVYFPKSMEYPKTRNFSTKR